MLEMHSSCTNRLLALLAKKVKLLQFISGGNLVCEQSSCVSTCALYRKALCMVALVCAQMRVYQFRTEIWGGAGDA